MPVHRRNAEFVATLVYTDEPQVLALKAGKSLIAAVAIPDPNPEASKFLATTVAQKDWDSYIDESVDLRYLFTYPTLRLKYTFDLRKLKKNRVLMDPFDGEVPENWLPQPRFFAEYHTEEFDGADFQASSETLIVDGNWDMPEFGKFYQRYSDIYSLLVAILNWREPTVSAAVKAKVKKAFASKPFKGGSSYMHLYADLVSNLARSERLGLQEIKYASPGHFEVHGREDAFEDVQGVIRWFMDHRPAIQKKSVSFKAFLSKNGFLQMAGENFVQNNPFANFIRAEALALNQLMHGPNFETIEELAQGNALVTAKVVLSFYRRLDDAAEFFAQGRVNFSD